MAFIWLAGRLILLAEALDRAERLVRSETEIRAAILAGEDPESAFRRVG